MLSEILDVTSVSSTVRSFTKQTYFLDNGDFYLYSKDNVVQGIILREGGPLATSVLSQRWSLYEPEDMFQLYGVPSRMYIQRESGPSATSFELWLFYDDQGFVVRYFGNGTPYSAGLRACPDFSLNGIESIMIAIQSVNITPALEYSIDPNDWGSYFRTSPDIRTLEDATGLCIGDFIDLFVGNSPTYCFTIN